MADNHTVYKNGAKEIAHLNGCSITFMAKPDHSWIGSSCHIHTSLWREGANAFDGGPDVFKQFLAGWIAGAAKELAIFLAPTINSYKRYAAGSWAPTTLGRQRSAAAVLRVAGLRAGLRCRRHPGPFPASVRIAGELQRAAAQLSMRATRWAGAPRRPGLRERGTRRLGCARRRRTPHRHTPVDRLRAELHQGLQHLTGALANEVVVMNSLTVNLHLMMASVFTGRSGSVRQDTDRVAGAFSSDRHAFYSRVNCPGTSSTPSTRWWNSRAPRR